MASSAQNGGGTAKIELWNPNSIRVIEETTAAGAIANRTAELAGPQLFGGSVAGKYTPIYYQVPAGGDGIYRVQFYARSTTDGATTVLADASWSQGANSGIAAWDVSVINTDNTAFIPGRVYTNVLNLNNGTTTPNTTMFYGIVYALTKDGYIYKINNNGNNGMYFTFMVNNNGVIDTNGNPTYKSLDALATSSNIKDPNSPDTATQITHKIFYTLPANDLPDSANGGTTSGSGSTWLRKSTISPPTVTNVQIQGIEGTIGKMGYQGGYINFTSNIVGNYKIDIESTAIPAAFVTRTLTGTATVGSNSILWDAKDGDGVLIPTSDNIPIKVKVQLQGAEVHFPFIDMEYNINGIIIQLLDHNNLPNVLTDIVYWDDSSITIPSSPNGTSSSPLNNSQLPPTNSTGISSSTNGHKWGQGALNISGQFGDNKTIDTWTFIKGLEETLSTSITVREADLLVSSMTKDKTKISALEETVTYTIKLKNNGPSDVTASTTGGAPFSFILPTGFTASDITPTFSGNSCGSEATAITYNSTNRTYNSVINLPSGCEITYAITVKAVAVSPGTTPNFTATVLRPVDVTDPDATNYALATTPTDPFSECTNNGLGGICNNILENTVTIASINDNDNDGITNETDPDDDNDGILDCDENFIGTDSSINNLFSFAASGTAEVLSYNEVRLTKNLNTQKGQVWSIGKVDFTKSFTLRFDAYLGTDIAGADGIAAVFHNSVMELNASGTSGGGLGASGIDKGIVLELDTYNNPDFGDLAASHGQIWDSDNQSASGGGFLTNSIALNNLEDGLWHPVVITWNATTSTISYTVDGINAGTYTGDLINGYFGGSSMVYFGFTASTGGATNEQKIRINSFCNDVPLQVDSDNDGIINQYDLDSDNDGILDAVENTSCGATGTTFSTTGYKGFVYDVPTAPIDGWATLNASSTFPIAVYSQVATFDYNEFANTTNAFNIDFNVLSNLSGTNPDIKNYSGNTISPPTREFGVLFKKVITQDEVGTYQYNLNNADNHIFIYKNGVKVRGIQNPWDIGTPKPVNNFATITVAAGDTIDVLLVEEDSGSTYVNFSVIKTKGNCTTDKDADGIKDFVDLDSDGDGCSDALEGDENVNSSQLVSNRIAGTVDADGVPILVNAGGGADIGSDQGQGIGDAINAAIKSGCFCYKPAQTTGTVLDTHHGITSLGRAGTDNSNWPMVRKGAWTVLESKTKGFVINRLTDAQLDAIPAADLREGMIVYNITIDSLQINIDGTSSGWRTFNTQACPD